MHPFVSLFEDPGRWQVFASGQAEGRLSRIEAADGKPGLRLDYDFHGGGGFVVIRRAIRFKLPDTFEIGFLLRGEGPPNHFEFKVASPGGANVWRHLRQDYQMPREWSDCRFHERDLPFAWGPAGGGAPVRCRGGRDRHRRRPRRQRTPRTRPRLAGGPNPARTPGDPRLQPSNQDIRRQRRSTPPI